MFAGHVNLRSCFARDESRGRSLRDYCIKDCILLEVCRFLGKSFDLDPEAMKRIWELGMGMQVGDARWRSAQSAGTEIIEGLLNSLQTYTDLLKPDELEDMSRQGPASLTMMDFRHIIRKNHCQASNDIVPCCLGV